MKKILFAVMAVLLAMVSCTDSQFLDETVSNPTELSSTNELNTLIEKARWGDGQAFVKLADCYRDGKGVKQDFIGMLAMLSQADEYGGISNMEDYLKTLPEGSDFKLIFDAVENYERKNVEEATSMFEELIVKGCPDGYAVQGIMTMERGDTLEGVRLIEQAATAGSTFAELLQCVPDWRGATNPDLEKLAALSDKIPFVNTILGKMYAGFEDENLQNDQLAAYYYLKADEKACLGKRGARWLLGYHKSGANLPVSERDIQRLQILAGETPVDKQEPTTNRDEALEASVSSILQEAMTERDCTKGMVYVVETATGAIKAQVSLSSKGKQFVPYENTYDKEQSVMMTGPTYLALLSTGKISSDDVIDTEFGIYKDVKDHNWHRGGYGQLTLEQALGYRSQVAFTKAKERVYGNQTILLDNKISEYLADMPDNAMGMLTFYNAVANCGRMVKLQAEGDDVVVLNEQMEKFADTQEHYVSLLTFCDCEKKYVFDKVPVNEARPLTVEDYQPCCCTPLYDAMGFTLTSMSNHVRNIEDAVVVVTIITDGLENASKEYTGAAIKQLVEKLKGEGWTFTYMGANQDSVEVAFNLSIRNARNFDYSAQGTMAGMAKDTSTRMNFFSRLAHFKEDVECCEMPVRERRACYTAMADEAFDEEESKS